MKHSKYLYGIQIFNLKTQEIVPHQLIYFVIFILLLSTHCLAMKKENTAAAGTSAPLINKYEEQLKETDSKNFVKRYKTNAPTLKGRKLEVLTCCLPFLSHFKYSRSQTLRRHGYTREFLEQTTSKPFMVNPWDQQFITKGAIEALFSVCQKTHQLFSFGILESALKLD